MHPGMTSAVSAAQFLTNTQPKVILLRVVEDQPGAPQVQVMVAVGQLLIERLQGIASPQLRQRQL